MGGEKENWPAAACNNMWGKPPKWQWSQQQPIHWSWIHKASPTRLLQQWRWRCCLQCAALKLCLFQCVPAKGQHHLELRLRSCFKVLFFMPKFDHPRIQIDVNMNGGCKSKVCRWLIKSPFHPIVCMHAWILPWFCAHPELRHLTLSPLARITA